MIIISNGDITETRTDAIVNAANSILLPGGGVSGHIHKKAGPGLYAECQAFMNSRNVRPLDTGEVFISSGHSLPCKIVIHVTGPVWRGGMEGEVDKLITTYRNILTSADNIGVNKISIPCISTGTYGFPKEDAAVLAIDTIKEFMENSPRSIRVVTIVCFDDENYDIYLKKTREVDTPDK
jgi:O-acetyl-ADP-ribose deacetylase (regulator of RNase III)